METFLQDLIGYLQVLIGIGFLIFIHEGGHYLAARAAGVRVDIFSLGFGPRIWGFKKGPTDYRISAVPFGGYVLVAGADPTRPPMADDELVAKSALQRSIFYVGGIVMNVLFAFAIFALVFAVGVPFTAPVIGGVTPASPAWQAGLQPGDRIVEVDGSRVRSFDTLFLDVALSDENEPLKLLVERDGEQLEILTSPEYSADFGVRELGVLPAAMPEPLRIASVDSGSPAEAAGLRAEDRIVAINGESALGDRMLAALARAIASGDEVSLDIERAGQRLADPIRFVPDDLKDAPKRLGVALSYRRIEALRDTEFAPLKELDLQIGDILLEVDGEPFRSVESADLFENPTPGSATPLRVVLLRGERRVESEIQIDDAGRERLRKAIAFGAPEDGVVLEPQRDTPAERAGIEIGDRLLRVRLAGQSDDDWSPVSEFADLISFLAAANEERPEGPQLELELDRRGERVVASLSPEPAVLKDQGFTYESKPFDEEFRTEGPWTAVLAGFDSSIDLIRRLYVTIQRIVTGDVSSKNLSGPIGISKAVFKASERGWTYWLYMLGLISMNLAIINLLPIPLFDGGSLLFVVIEKIKGSPVDARVMGYSQIVGLAFILFLFVYVTYNDILRLAS